VLRESVGDGGHEAYTATLWGVGLSLEMQFVIAEAETFSDVEGNMGGPAMRGAVALPGSQATSRREGTRRNLGGLTSGRTAFAVPVRIGKVRSRSR